MFLATTILMGLRSRYVGGVDTNLYFIPAFQRVSNYSSIKQLLLNYVSKDPLFYISTWGFTRISTDYNLWIFTISAIVMASFCLFVYRYSDNPPVAFIVYFALGYYTIGFQMMRHVLAVSVLLFSYKEIQEKHLLRFIVIVLIASGFHSTALIFLIAYPLAHYNIGLKQWAFIGAAIIAIYFFRTNIVNVLNLIFINNNRYSKFTSENYGIQLSAMGLIILLCVYAASYYLCPKEEMKGTAKGLFNLCAIGVAFMSMIAIIAEFHRISMYFGIYNTILLPNAMKKYNGKYQYKLIINGLIVIILIMYFILFRVGNDFLDSYNFFWND